MGCHFLLLLVIMNVLFIHILRPAVPSRFSHVRLCATLRTVALQAPLFMEFSRQEYWSELPFHPSGDFPDPGIKPTSPTAPALQVDSLPLSHLGSPGSCDRKDFKIHMVFIFQFVNVVYYND